tara:strand:+ start:408 stop:932 length:525 start_codon:yes stop_codon:yes gene_type:complete
MNILKFGIGFFSLILISGCATNRTHIEKATHSVQTFQQSNMKTVIVGDANATSELTTLLYIIGLDNDEPINKSMGSIDGQNNSFGLSSFFTPIDTQDNGLGIWHIFNPFSWQVINPFKGKEYVKANATFKAIESVEGADALLAPRVYTEKSDFLGLLQTHKATVKAKAIKYVEK